MSDDNPFNDLETIAIREGVFRSQAGEHSEPLLLTSSYVFESAAHAAARFSGESEGNVYSRYTNPTVRMFEERYAALEGAQDAIATSSGMAAIMSVFMTFLKAGDHVLCSRSIFGSTIALLDKFFVKMNIEVDYIVADDYQLWQEKIKPNTALLFVESPSNPLNELVDIKQVAELVKDHQALLVVDNTYSTPIFQQPLTLGADISVCSATKYIDGQGRALGGVVAASAEHVDAVRGFVRSAGPSMSPFNAWVFLKGLETLSLRMREHGRTALKLAQWLDAQEQIEHVYYSGLESHPQYQLATEQHINDGFAAVISFDIKGDQAAAWRFIDRVKVFSLTANLGDAKSTIVHPASTTHSRLTQAMRDEVGIKDQLIRISVGLESYNDLVADLQRGMDAI